MILKQKNQKGFTLIEILISISIIGILMSVTIAAAIAVQKNGRDAKRKADLRSIQTALQQYYADQFEFPNFVSLPSAISEGAKTYLRNVPKDPSTSLNYGYSSISCDINNDNCQRYCLYAKLEFQKPSIATPVGCSDETNFPAAISEILSTP